MELLLYLHLSIIVMSIAISGCESTDLLALQDLKNRITDDPLHVMASWNDHSSHFCNWTGVTCSPYNDRVINLDLSSRKLVGTIPSSIGNLSFLTAIHLENNSFHGEIPQAIGLLLQLEHLNLSSNSFSGKIPTKLTYCKELRVLDLRANDLVGKIVDQLSSLSKLNFLRLKSNSFTGGIPYWIGNFSSLKYLDISSNSLQGPIPQDLGRLMSLEVLKVYESELSGTIPSSILNISSIYYLSVTQNLLHGQLPASIGLTLPNLEVFAGAINSFTGCIPPELGKCNILSVLNLTKNHLVGSIPEEVAGLSSLSISLSLASNSFTGPEFLGKLPYLRKLDLSFIELEGKVPNEGIFANTSAFSINGNNRLCGGVPNLHLPECSKATKPLDSRVLLAVIVTLALSVLVLCSCAAYYKLRNSRKAQPWNAEQLFEIPRTTYRAIHRATNGFSDANLVGRGSFGSVYKAHFDVDNTIMAVKVLNLQQRGALRSFLDECRALRNIRHRNLLKIKTACSSIDHQGNDFKCLVFEFMTNGNLHYWLHPEKYDQQHQTKKLTFIHRLNIAIDVASALDYLHNYCQTPIVHCDLKPSNILLDEDMSARVGDFGLATFLFDTSSNSWSHQISAALKGSIGYIPTEYGSGVQASTRGDVYSYGIVLLELFICRRPTDPMFHENLDIHKYVSMALPAHVMEIIDPILLLAEEEKNMNRQDQLATRMEEYLLSILEIGLTCSASSPRERMPINTVLSKLQAIKKSFLSEYELDDK